MQIYTPAQRETYHDIICSGQAALRRWSPSNPMRTVIERQIDDARRVLGIRVCNADGYHETPEAAALVANLNAA